MKVCCHMRTLSKAKQFNNCASCVQNLDGIPWPSWGKTYTLSKGSVSSLIHGLTVSKCSLKAITFQQVEAFPDKIQL